MAINLTNLNNRNQQIEQAKSTQQRTRVTNESNAAASKSPTSAADSVNITQQAKSLTAMEQNLAQGTPVNETKVANLKKAIADGSYSVNAEKLAKNMANFESQLIR